MLFRDWRLTFRLLAAALSGTVLLAGTTLLAGAAGAAERNPPARGTTVVSRLVVKWNATSSVAAAPLASRRSHLQQRMGAGVVAARHLTGRSDLYALNEPLSGARLAARLATLRADPAVASVHPDVRVFAHASAPDDTRYVAGSDTVGSWVGQWYLGAPTSTLASSINVLGAWDVTEGLASVVVAVLDTGVDFAHNDLLAYGSGGKLLPGYDFVSCDTGAISCTATTSYNNSHDCTISSSTCTLVANDGDGWDSDPTDPGDWIDATDLARSDGFFSGCGGGDNYDEAEPSSWHGTRTAGLIGALTHNSLGIAGVAPNTLIEPVRVLGKCGGYLADVIDAMRWAAGLSVSGAPTNPYPAKVINLSLGSSVPCTDEEQSAIDDVIAAGVVVVASAGNDGGPVNAPANCSGVLSVAGLRHNGEKVGYSSVSGTTTPVSIAAPAGNCGDNYTTGSSCLYSMETTTNEGSTTPDSTSFYTYAVFDSSYSGNSSNEASVGTSFSAPLAAGVAALMLAVDSQLTPAQLITRMQSTATAFPVVATDSTGAAVANCAVRSETVDSDGYYTDVPSDSDLVACNCTTASCGAGMLNAAAAVTAAQQPYAVVTASESKASIGDKVQLYATGSHASDGYSITRYHWSTDPDVSVANADTASAYFLFPALRPLTATLTITDSAGRTASASVTIEGAISSSDIGKAGGGALRSELIWLGLLALGAIIRRRRLSNPR
ncbi:MAG: S8 family serine peptidase [Steroidobacteraceae bacterium]